jgi:hypothetical protein
MPAKEPGFAERLQTAANAKKAQLQKIRSSAPPDGARSTERQAAQAEAVAARKIRTAGVVPLLSTRYGPLVVAERRSSRYSCAQQFCDR